MLAEEIDPPIKKEHQPEILILPFSSFGIGTRLRLKRVDAFHEEDYEIDGWGGLRYDSDAIVTKIYEENGKIIIDAETQTKKEDKVKLVDKIIKKVDFDNALNENIFIEILSNVFTEEQLKKFLEQDDIEVLLFKGLMYLKVGDKAYRL